MLLGISPELILIGHTLLTEKNSHTVFFYVFFQQHVEKNMGFIRVIYANDRIIMAIRANTAKYGSLTGKNKNKKRNTYGAPGGNMAAVYPMKPRG